MVSAGVGGLDVNNGEARTRGVGDVRTVLLPLITQRRLGRCDDRKTDSRIWAGIDAMRLSGDGRSETVLRVGWFDAEVGE